MVYVNVRVLLTESCAFKPFKLILLKNWDVSISKIRNEIRLLIIQNVKKTMYIGKLHVNYFLFFFKDA